MKQNALSCLVAACLLTASQPASAKRCTAEKGLYTVTLSRPIGTCPKQFLGHSITKVRISGRVKCGTSHRSRSTFRSNGCRYRCGPYRQQVNRQTLRFSFRCRVSCGKAGRNAALGLAQGGQCRFEARAIARKQVGTITTSASDIKLPRDRRLLFNALRAATISKAAIRRARADKRRARLSRQVARIGVLKILGTKGSSSGAVANVLGRGNPDSVFRGSGGSRGGVAGIGLRGSGGGGGYRSGYGAAAGRLTTARRSKPAARATRVAVGSLRLSPRLEPMSIQRTLASYLPSVRRCLHQRSTPGIVRLILQVHHTGTPRVVGVRTADRPFARCVERLAATWRFKPPVGKGSARLTIPFILSR